jgi:PAS domain S-box-containing protein
MASGLPGRARIYLSACVAAGAFAVAFAGASVRHVPFTPEGPIVVSGGLLVLAACFFLQTRSPVLAWRGERIAMHPDEAVLLLGCVFLPPGIVVLACALAATWAQISQGKPSTKLVFNVAVQALAASLGAMAFTLAVAAGLPALAAAVLVPLVVSATNQTLVGGLLTLLGGEPLRSMWRAKLLTSVAMSSVAGITLGLLSYGLFQLHPLAVILLAPIGYGARAAVSAEYRHENELAVRRALQRITELLARGPSEEELFEAAHDACREALPLQAFRVARSDDTAPAWSRSAPAGAGASCELSSPLVDAAGTKFGEVFATVAWRGRAQAREDAEALGLVSACLGMAITTLRSAEASRAAQARLRDVFDTLDDPVLLWSRDGHLLHHNRAAREAFLVEGPSTTWPDLAQVLDSASMDAILTHLALHPGERGGLVVRDRAIKGELRTYELTLAPAEIAHKDDGILFVARDVTERLRLERETAAARETAARQDRLAALGVLVAGVAHEVNNPLFYMQGNVELAVLALEDAEEDVRRAGMTTAGMEEARERLGAVMRGIERVSHISRALKAVAHKPRRSPLEPIDAADILKATVQSMRASLPAGVTLELVSSPEPLLVRGDPMDLQEVVLHLTRNAIEALGKEPGRVEVRASARRGALELRVSDTGCGIPADAKARVFVPFYTTKPDGVGLGLAMVHTLVTDHGGEISFDSTEGRGTTFLVTLPLVASRTAPFRAGITWPV